ncbi:MAG: hypothetical protein Q8P93_03395 [bacterium]|nr:hypothetical protein [bacterium]
MSHESPTESAHESRETLSERFNNRLNAILDQQLTPENIDVFAETALRNTIQLVDAVVTIFRQEQPEHITENTQQLEDEAFSFFGLTDIQEVLQKILVVQERVDRIKEYLLNQHNSTLEVITPTKEDASAPLTGSGRGFEEKIRVHRLLTLLYILESDFDLNPEDVELTRGSVTPDMVRREPYVRVCIPELHRVVYVCDEEGNASYIFDTEKLDELGFTLEEIDLDDKESKDYLIAQTNGLGKKLKQSQDWRARISNYMDNPLSNSKHDDESNDGSLYRPATPELRRKRKVWPSYEDFQIAVQAKYNESGQPNPIKEWYNSIREEMGWTEYSSIRRVYSENWNGISTLVGKEEKIPWPSYEDFQIAVQAKYNQCGQPFKIREWYDSIREEMGWPSYNSIRRIYPENWQGLSLLVGIESMSRFLPFNELRNEVRLAYNNAGRPENTTTWYRKEFKKHKGWHSSPYRFIGYKDNWKGWSHLVGKEEDLED